MKRILSGLMAALMLTALLPAAALAAPLPTREEAAQVLAALDIMTGNEAGDLMLGSTVTRAEFTKLAVSASPFRDSVGPETATDPYPDVPRSHWAAGYIQAAVANGLVRGDLYGNFQPSRTITLAEGVTIVLRLLGYQDSDFTGAYPAGQMSLYKTLELDAGVTASGPNAALTRENALFLFYNLLTAKTKTGGAYLTVVMPNEKLLTASGEIDMVALVNSAMNGPIVAEGAWQTKVPFDIASATVYRAGVRSDASAIIQNDVVYYSKPMRTLWVYANRVSGAIGTVTPSSAPTAVTVAGKSYGIETSAAAYALSDLGTHKAGDIVTLLLGRDGRVVSVLSAGSAQASGTVCGLVTAVGSGTYTDAKGNDYTASTVTVTATDGSTYAYRWDKSGVKAGNLVQVTTADGATQIKTLSSSSLTGKVSADGKKFASYPIAENAEILDTFDESQAMRIYPARLAGVTLGEGAVRYYQLNAQGEISKLILKNVTGDLHQYGVLISVSEKSEGMALMGSYTYDIGGVSASLPASTTLYGVHTGPFQLRQEKGQIKMANLTTLKITGVDGNTAIAANRNYTISDQVAVYEIRNNDYFLTSLSAVSGEGYTLTGWYDKEESAGGRIRVITARVG